jgi:molybdate transport system substrate-binding protein
VKKITKVLIFSVGALVAFSFEVSFSAGSVVSRAEASTGTVTVFAASSLTKAYSSLGAKFQAAHPGITIRFSFGSSTTLATQINAGAPADIFASADTASMVAVKAEIPHALNYLVNQVVVAVAKNSAINSVKDLNGSTIWIQCSHTVPCGSAADSALAAEGTVKNGPASFESSAATTLAKLLAGSVDAAIIYRTDVIANSSKLRAIPFSDSVAASTQYQIGISTLKTTVGNHWAQTFYSYLKGHDAKKFLTASGFMLSQ